MPSKENLHDMSKLELTKTASKVISKGGNFWMKFTCTSCGSRQTCEEINTLFKEASCEECGKITEIEKAGLLVMFSFGPTREEQNGQ